LYTECTVNKLLIMHRGTVRNIEFHARMKCAKLVRLVGFIKKKSLVRSAVF